MVLHPQVHTTYRRLPGARLLQRMGGRAQGGFSLVELMVAVALSMLLMVALAAVYLNVSRTNTEMAKTNAVIENGRFAIDIVSEDLVHAGFWGGYVPQFDDVSASAVPGDAPSLTPDPCLAFSAANWTTAYKNALIGIAVQTFDDVPTGCTALVTDKKANTDVLVVRHVDNCLPGSGSCEADNANKVYFQAAFCDTEIAAGDRYVLGNTTFPLTNKNCTTVADKRKFVSNIYWVRTFAVAAGDGIPTLMRASFDLNATTPAFTTPVPLIEGIEGFRVELGVDAKSRCGGATDYTAANLKVSPSTCVVDAVDATNNTLPNNRGDGVPETPFVHCTTGAGCTSVQLTDVVVAKLYVLARSSVAAPGHVDSKTYKLGGQTIDPLNDGFKRHVFQTVVRINNVSSRRETP